MCLQKKAQAKRVYCTVINSKSATFTTENNSEYNGEKVEVENATCRSTKIKHNDNV